MPHRSCGKSLVQLLDSVRAPANRSNCCVASNKFNQPTYQTDHGNQKTTGRFCTEVIFWGFWGSLTPWLMWKWLSSMAPMLTHLSCHWLSTSITEASKKFHQHFQNVGHICMYLLCVYIYKYNRYIYMIYVQYIHTLHSSKIQNHLKNTPNTKNWKFYSFRKKTSPSIPQAGRFLIPPPLTVRRLKGITKIWA